MSLLQLIQSAQNGEGIHHLAGQFGLSDGEANELTQMFAPAIAAAASKMAAKGGLDDLLGAFMGEAQGEMFDDPARAAEPEGQMQGMQFLKTVMRGEQAPQAIAEEAAGRTGIDPSIILQFLPALAVMVQGGMQRNLPDGDLNSARESAAGSGLSGLFADGGQGPLGKLGALLDQGTEPSPMNGLIGKFMR